MPKKKVTYEVGAQEEWDERTQHNVYLPSKVDVHSILFGDLFEEYLPKGQLKAIEIGAIPGRFLVYLNKQHGYDITGLDFSANTDAFHQTMKKNNINKYNFINQDFLTFNSKLKYDVVLSFGFIEHFDDYESIIKKHCDLVRKGGYVFLEVPNFRKLQYIYHYFFDKKNLDIHNTEVMDLKLIGNILKKEGFQEVFSGYVERLDTWREPAPIGPAKKIVNSLIMSFIRRFGTYFPVSPLYSPFMVAIYKKSNL